MLFNSTKGALDLRELCEYGYDHQAKGQEWASRPTSTPNPRRNKHVSDKLVNELRLYFSTDHLVVVRLSPAFQTESGELRVVIQLIRLLCVALALLHLITW